MFYKPRHRRKVSPFTIWCAEMFATFCMVVAISAHALL